MCTMKLVTFSFYLSMLLCTFYITFCANDGGDSLQKNKSISVDLGLFGIIVHDNDYFKEIRHGRDQETQEIVIKKSFTIDYFAHFFAAKFENTAKYTFLYSSRVCDLIDDKRADKSKMPADFFPRQMIKKLFPKINSCEFKAGSTFIKLIDTLWMNPKHQTSINFPKEEDFYMVINIGKEDDKNDPEDSFVLSSLWVLRAGAFLDALEHIKAQMVKTANIKFYGLDVNKNDYFGRARQQTSIDVNAQEIIIKKSFTIEYFAHFFEFELEDYGRATKYKPLYSSKVCDLINDKRDKSKIPDDFFPRQMIKELFPKTNSCQIKADTMPINLTDTLHLNPEHQTGFVFPKNSKFNMVLNIGKEDDKNNPENGYVLSAFWMIQTFK